MAIRLIQVGLGGWGLDWAEAVLPDVASAKVVAFVDADPKVLQSAAQRLSLPPDSLFPNLRTALGAVEADAVLVVLPLAAHVPVSAAALQAGKHVLVEKPFAPTLEEARALNALAAQCGRVLMVSQNYRHHAAVATVARLLRSGEMGKVLSSNIEFRKNWKVTSHRYYEIPGPLLLDMAVHHFDLVRLLFGEVARLACRSWNTPDSPFREHAAAEAILEMQSGMIVGYHGSWLSRGAPTTWGGAWTIECEEGVVAFSARGFHGSAEDEVVVYGPDGSARHVPLAKLAHIDRAGALAAFAAAVTTGHPPPDFTSGTDNIRSLALCFASMRSAAAGGSWIAPADFAG